MNHLNKHVNILTVRTTTILVLLLFIIHIKGYGQTSMNFKDAITQVLEKNPNLSSEEANLESSRYNIALAKSKYLPGLNILGSVSQSKTATFSQTAGIIPSSSGLIGASLSQMIYNEKQVANIKIQKYLFASQEEMYRSTQFSIISAAGMSYIGLLFSEDILDVQQKNMRITEKNVTASRDRFEVGSTNMQEVLRWETQLYSTKQDIQSQKAAVIISRGRLNQLLNEPIETTIDLEKLTLENNGFIFSSPLVAATAIEEEKALIIRDYLVELGLANSPVLASMQQLLLAQDRELDANKRWAIPNFSASASTDAKFDLNKDESEVANSDIGFWKVGITMFLPLMDGGANINKVKQSRLQLSALEYEINDIKTSLEQTIRASAAVLISDFLNIGFAEEQSKAAFKNYELVSDAYFEGESSLLDLLDAQNQKLMADTSTRVALYTFFNDLLTVEQVIGYFPFLETNENNQVIISELERRLLEAK